MLPIDKLVLLTSPQTQPLNVSRNSCDGFGASANDVVEMAVVSRKISGRGRLRMNVPIAFQLVQKMMRFSRHATG
jgi:hypothetical protein